MSLPCFLSSAQPCFLSSALLTQCPELVRQLIAWYQWKAKINECHKELEEIQTKLSCYTFDMLQWRDPENLPDYYIMNFLCDQQVAILPKRYFYSSGLHYSNGFFSYKIKHWTKYKGVNTWLPDFY